MNGVRSVALAAYAASKGAITNLVRQLALDLAPSNITVNAIAPAAVRTAIADGFYEDQEAVAALLKDVPLGRAVEPSELLGLAVLLAAPASDFITGQTLVIDGGFLAH